MTRPALRWFVVGGLALTAALVVVLGPRASSAPDGLERVAIDEGFAATAEPHDLADGPLGDYEIRGVEGGWSVGLAGLVGVGLTFVVAGGVALVLRRRS